MTVAPAVIKFFKGRVALHAILEAANIGPGDKVILPGYTCVVVPNAILYRGAVPVFVDIDPLTYNLDLPSVTRALAAEQKPGAIKAIIAQHTYGLPVDMDAINSLAAENSWLVIEDACHALGSTIDGKPVGSLGQAAFFSSQWSKPVTTGLGGWAQVSEPGLAAKVEQIAQGYPRPPLTESLFIQMQYLAYRLLYSPRLFWTMQGVYRKLGSLGLAIGSSSKSELDCLQPGDYHRRMGSLQARGLARQLRDLKKVTEQRRQRAQSIETALQRHGIPLVPVDTRFDPVWLRYPVRVLNKDQVLASAKAHRIELGDWFLSPVHPNPAGWEKAGYIEGSCPLAETAARQVLNISTNPQLTEKEIARIVGFLAQHGEFPTLAQEGPAHAR